MWLTSQTGADVGSCSPYDWVVGGPECWPPQADEDELDPTNCANRCRWFCELLILAEVVLPCTWFSALPRGRSRGFDHFSVRDETLNPSGLSLPFGCTDSHGLSSGRILCEQFSVPNHPKMGMYLRRMNLTQACARRVKGNLAEVLLDSFSKGWNT